MPFQVFALGAKIVRRQRIDLSNAAHERHQRRADRTTRADKVAILERLGHKLLRNHIHHVVALPDDRLKLLPEPVLNRFRDGVAVHPLSLIVAKLL